MEGGIVKGIRVAPTCRAIPVLLLLVAVGVLSAPASGLAAAGAAPLAWDAARPITWSDFRGRAPANATSMTQAAAIHMTLGWHAVLNVTWEERTRRWQGVIDRAAVTVTNTMEPLESWVALGKERSEVLQHEQRHFDLNEVYRRRLFNALAGLRAEGTTRAAAEQALRDALQETSSRLLAQASEAQARYDEETSHGTNALKQAEWSASIASWLTSLPLPPQEGKPQTRPGFGG